MPPFSVFEDGGIFIGTILVLFPLPFSDAPAGTPMERK